MCWGSEIERLLILKIGSFSWRDRKSRLSGFIAAVGGKQYSYRRSDMIVGIFGKLACSC